MPHSINTTADDALGTSDLTDLVARLANREVSPRELREAALARAATAEPHINALTGWLDEPGPDSSLTPTGSGPFAGIPTFIKDNEPILGRVASHGSRAVPKVPARITSPIVDHLLRLGLAPIATTTLPEFGLTATTESTRFGATRNPWSLDRSSGGSSGGSAAVAAAGVVPLVHANDGGGSIRIPASACGLVGLKPTRGRLIDAPEMERLPVKMITQGVLTRSVRDTALFYAEYERIHRNSSLPPIGHVTRPGRRLRIAVLPRSLSKFPVSRDVLDAVETAGKVCESLGHEIVEAEWPVDDDFGPDLLRYWGFLAFLLHRTGAAIFGRGFDPGKTEPLTRELSALVGRHVDRMPATLRRLRRLARETELNLEHYDVAITAVTAHPAPEIGYLGPDVPAREHLLRLLRYTTATPIQNVSGSPAMSLPLGRSSLGLPVGVQLCAGFGRERTLLQLALELEEASPWPVLPPQMEAAS